MSTIPLVILGLVALGEATFDSDLWQVVDGPIGTVTTTKSRLFAVGAEEIFSPVGFDSLGAQGMEERYTVPLVVSVTLSGADTLPMARSEAFAALDDYCDALLAGDRRLGLGAQGVLNVVPTADRRLEQAATANGRFVAVRFGAEVYAQLV